MIGIIGAMDIEVDGIKASMTDKESATVSGIEFVKGKLCGKEVVVAKCGIGKVFAAVCAQTMILNYKVDALINTGVAGGLSEKLKKCDMVVSSGVVQHDMDTSPIGDPLGMLSEIKLVEIPADKALVSKAENAIRELNIGTMTGVIASGDQFIADKDRKKFIVDNFNGIACEMEGASIGHVAYINNVPFVVLRAISDGADDNSDMDFPAFARLAAENSIKVVFKLAEAI